jgi:hypothetical protein
LDLARFIFSSAPLDNDKYTTNLISKEKLFTYVNDFRIARRKELMKQVDSFRQAAELRSSKRIEMTNIKTNEVFNFDSINATARYLKSLYPDYKCSPGMVSDSATKGRIYKGLFKFKRI